MNKLIKNALSKLKIDVAFMEYHGKADKYIIFNITKEKDTAVFDNINQSITYDINLNFWYKKPEDFAYINKIKQTMKEAGFIFDSAKDLKYGEFYGKNYDFVYIEYL